MEVTFALGAEMLLLGGGVKSVDDAWRMMDNAITSGLAREKFGEILEAQGGDRSILDDISRLPIAEAKREFLAPREGFIAQVAPRVVGHGIIALGGGRRTMADDIDPSVGFIIAAKPGDRVERGQPLATVHARDENGLAIGAAALREAIVIADSKKESLELVSHRMTATGRTKWKAPRA
jgi:pyrimidine-nucleoside phosphorylase